MLSASFRSVCHCGAALFVPILSVQAGVIFVNAAAPAGGDGTSWASARNDLQTALASAQSGDEIWVAQGVYKPHPTNRLISFDLKNGVAIYGGFTGVEESVLQRNPANTSTLSGEIGGVGTSDNSFHVVQAINVNASATLDGFLITAGQAVSGSPWDVTVSYGGGMYLDASRGSSPTIRSCVFSNNAASASGGAIYIAGGTVRLERCFFFGNRISGSSGVGGAIGAGTAIPTNLTLANCVFAQNFTLSASGGGAINAYGSDTVNVYSSTFYNNSASSGSVFAGGAAANFRNCVFAGSGGAAGYFATPVSVQSSVIPGGMSGAGNIATGATFVNAPAANFRLAPGSTGIDVGNNSALPSGGLPNDYDVNPRVLNFVIDMGAFEFVALTCAGDLNKDGVVDDSDFVVFAGAYNYLLDHAGDLNADLVTDDADFVIFASAYDALVCP